MFIRAFSRVIGCLLLLAALIGSSLSTLASSPEPAVHSANTAPGNQVQYFVYLPGASRNYAACTIVPNLYSPADGSTLNTTKPTFILDGGSQEQANATWLEYDFSQDPNFATLYHGPGYLQPAQKYWELVGMLTFEPGTYYWRAALWCNGPGWPPPPNPGEVRGPFSEVFRFTIEP